MPQHPQRYPPLVQGNATANYIRRHPDKDDPTSVAGTLHFALDRV
ncbi:hypothetical protein [Paenibacillus chibensis]